MKEFETSPSSLERLFQFGSWTFDVQTGLMQWSEGIWCIFGFESYEMNHQPQTLDYYRSFIHPDDLSSLEEYHLSLRDLKNASPVSYRIIDKYKKTKTVYRKIHTSSTRPHIIEGYLSEVTNIINLNTEELIKENQLMERAEELRNFGSWSWDFTTGKLEWSEGIYRIFGYTDPKDRPRNITIDFFYENHVPVKERKEQKRTFQETVTNRRKEYHTQWVGRRKDGKMRILSEKGRVYYDQTGKPLKIEGSTADITEEHQLRENVFLKDKLIIDNELRFGYGSWRWNVPTGEVNWSEGAFKVMGAKPENHGKPVTYQTFFECLDPKNMPVLKANLMKPCKNAKATRLNSRCVIITGM